VIIGTITFHLYLPGCASLKEKRSRLKPLLARLHREFNVSSAEVDLQDKWQESVIACGMVANDRSYLQAALETVRKWVEANWPDGDVIGARIEIV